jgi:hypothetical protein
MSIFGKSVRDYFSFVRIGIILILAMGVVRFALGLSGVAYEKSTHLASLTILGWILAVIYGHLARVTGFGRYRQLLPMAFTLAVTMYGFIILAIVVESQGGLHGYFHAPGLGLMPGGMSVVDHVIGQLLAMLVTTVLLWALASLGFALSSHLGYLRNAFVFLAAIAVLRALVGALGVPYRWGTWPTSVTLLALVLSFYYGYRAPANGFNRYKHPIVIGSILAVFMSLLVVYGILATAGLDVPSYFHSPGEGFQPAGNSVSEHALGHLRMVMPFAIVLLSLIASIGFALGKRRTLSAVGQPAVT